MHNISHYVKGYYTILWHHASEIFKERSSIDAGSGSLPPLQLSKKSLAEINNLDPYGFVLSGGEDYKLLITIPGKNLESFQKLFEKQKPCPIYHVGEVTKELGSKMIKPDGKEELLEVTGFDHFALT